MVYLHAIKCCNRDVCLQISEEDVKKLHRALLKALHPDKIAAPAGESEEERERRVRDVVNPRFHGVNEA